MKKNRIKITPILFLALLILSFTSCHDFVFGKVSVNDEENPIIQKKTPRTGADIYYGTEEGQHILPVDKNANVQNPDPDGAFANWYTCLVMMKEGHSHYFGKMHGNPVYKRKAWKQEQFAEIRNTASGKPELIMDTKSIRNFLEEQRGEEGPKYFRLVGGAAKMWALCLYFYDKEGKLINDRILKHSDQYQIFYGISDKDDKGQPYKVMDVRYRKEMSEKGRIDGVEAEYFKDKVTFEDRQAASPDIFQYTYRDTWTHTDMADGARTFFNLKLLPPLGPKDIFNVTAQDQDNVGLKGHFVFDFPNGKTEGLDYRKWPLELSKENSYGHKTYRRATYLLPKFYLAIRVMKCEKGKKTVVVPKDIDDPDDPDKIKTKSRLVCAPSYAPDPKSEWTELIRFNIPIKIFCSTWDTNPTIDDPYEPYYYHIAREIGLSPEETFESINSGGVESGMGFDVWFL